MKDNNKLEVADPTSELITIVGKVGDSVTIEIKNLPEDFSFAYTFFRNTEQECRLIKKEIGKAEKTDDKVTAEYLKSALQFFYDHPVPKNSYVGGVSFSPMLDAIQTLSYQGELFFTTPVALCVRNRFDIEIDAIHKEYKYCNAIARIIHKIDQVITIIRRADNENEAIETLQSELSLTVGEAECLCAARLDTIADKELVTQKIKSMKLLLAYLKHLKTINT